MIRVEDNGLVYFRQPDHFGDDQFTYAVFTRLGGASEGPFSSLNAGYHVGDDSRHVTGNRTAIAQALAFPLESLVAAQQIHGSRVAVIDRNDRGRGAANWEGALPQTDAMITTSRRTLLTLVVADCAILTFFDPTIPALGIAHCGWKGMLDSLGQKTIQTMHEAFGCRPQNLNLIISPSIGPCCYEVGEAVLAPLRATRANWQSLVREDGGKTYLDLWQMARSQAMDSGLASGNIFSSGLCTACHTDLFYSHRAEGGNTGRFAVLAGIL